MPIILRVELGLFVLIFMLILIKIISVGTLKLNYALVWFFACLIMGLAVLFPSLLDKFSYIIGIQYTSNLIFLMAFIFLLLIIFSLTLIISKQSIKMKKITQLIAIDIYENKKINKGE